MSTAFERSQKVAERLMLRGFGASHLVTSVVSQREAKLFSVSTLMSTMLSLRALAVMRVREALLGRLQMLVVSTLSSPVSTFN
jgi:hypothetical protein